MRRVIGTKVMRQGGARGLVHVYTREPQISNIPLSNAKGETIDPHKVVAEWKNLSTELFRSTLADSVHNMGSLGHPDAVRTGDLLIQYGEQLIPMPTQGIEHRIGEIADTMRFIRSTGNPFPTASFLQENQGKSRANAGDFVLLPQSMLMAISDRTNKAAIEQFTSAHTGSQNMKTFATHVIELRPGEPPLADVCFSCGESTIILPRNELGQRIATVIAKEARYRPWTFVHIDPACQVLSFESGRHARRDILCDIRFEKTLDMLAEAGLNPIPVDWEENAKLGHTMRSMVLVVRFASRGDFRNADQRGESTRSVFLQNNEKAITNKGTPFWSQLQNGEVPEAVYQPPPRYRPPMHRKGGIVPVE